MAAHPWRKTGRQSRSRPSANSEALAFPIRETKQGLGQMKLLTPEQTAEVLAVSRSTAMRMIAEGVIPSICLRSGRRKKVWRVREEILEKWLISREKNGNG